MRAQRRISKKIIGALFFLFCFAGAYLYYGLLPGNLRIKTIRKINTALPVNIAFDKALFLPFKGLCLRHLKVFDKAGLLIFSANEASLDAKILPFLKDKKIILSKISLDSPVYDWLLETDKTQPVTPPLMTKISGQIPVPTIPENRPPEISSLEDIPNAFLPENIYLQELQIKNGTVIARENKNSAVIETIHSIEVNVGFQKKPQLSFSGSLRLGSTPYASVNLEGVWNLKNSDTEFNFQSQSEKIPAWLADFQKGHLAVINQGRFLLQAHLKSLDPDKILFHAKATLSDALFGINKTQYQGAVTLDGNGIYDASNRTFIRYRGNLDLADGHLLHLSPQIPSIEHVSGKILFEPDTLAFQGIQGLYQSIPFQANGNLRFFKNPLINVEIRTASHMDQILSLIPAEQRKWLTNFEIKGNCQTVTSVNGMLKNPSSLAPEHQLFLEQGSLTSRDKKLSVTELSGLVGANKNGFRISNGRFHYLDKNYFLSASIPLGNQPGTLELESRGLKVSADYTIGKNALMVQKAVIDAEGILANINGRVSDLKNPALDLGGDMNVDLRKIMPFVAQQAPLVRELQPMGNVRGNFLLTGAWNHPANWNVKWDARGEQLFFKNKIKVDDFEAQIRLQNKVAQIPYLRANAYGGSLVSEIVLDFVRPETYCNLKAFINHFDLGAFMQDWNPQQKEMEGIVNFQLNLNGLLKNQDTLQGNGSVDIRDGRLWKTNLFKQMGSLPFVRVEGMDWVTFRRLSSIFDIHHKRIWTQSLNLFGDTVDLSMLGSIGFDQTLDLTMTVHFSNSILEGAKLTGGLVPFVVQQAENMISQYRITGTLKSPKFQKS